MERWLTDGLGLDWVTADAEAARLEHAISEVVEQRLYEVLGRPATCPHGNPIPGHSEATPNEVRLSSLKTGDEAKVTRRAYSISCSMSDALALQQGYATAAQARSQDQAATRMVASLRRTGALPPGMSPGVGVAPLPRGYYASVGGVGVGAARAAPLLLAYLHQRNLTPGRQISVIDADEVGKTLRVKVADREVTLSHETASKVWAVRETAPRRR